MDGPLRRIYAEILFRRQFIVLISSCSDRCALRRYQRARLVCLLACCHPPILFRLCRAIVGRVDCRCKISVVNSTSPLSYQVCALSFRVFKGEFVGKFWPLGTA